MPWLLDGIGGMFARGCLWSRRRLCCVLAKGRGGGDKRFKMRSFKSEDDDEEEKYAIPRDQKSIQGES